MTNDEGDTGSSPSCSEQTQNDIKQSSVDSFPRESWSSSASIDNQVQELQALIVDYEAQKVLLRLERKQWVLPGCCIHVNRFESSVEPIYVVPYVQEIIGTKLPLSFLGQPWRKDQQVKSKFDGLTRTLEKAVVLIEVMGEAAIIEDGFVCIPMTEAHVFHLFEDAANAIQAEIDWALKGTQPPNRLAWERPQWFPTIASWLEGFLGEHCDACLTEAVVFLRSSPLGVILQAKTTKGDFFLKCTPNLMNDAAYTEALAHMVPRYVSNPVFVDVDRQLMITADYGESCSHASFLGTKRSA